MDSCPSEMVEDIFNFLAGGDLINMFLISNKYSRIISNSVKLMGKIVLRLDAGKEFNHNLLKSNRKYSSVAWLDESTHLSILHWKMFTIIMENVTYVEFQDCNLFENQYKLIFDAVASTVTEVKFVKSAITKREPAANGKIDLNIIFSSSKLAIFYNR